MSSTTKKLLVIAVLLCGIIGAIRVNQICSNRRIVHVEPEYETVETPVVEIIEKKELICDFYDVPAEPIYELDEDDINILTNVVYGEARGLNNLERSAVVWCILNRVDSDKFPNTIYEVITAPNQFEGYSSTRKASGEVWESCRELVIDVLTRYNKEKDGWENVGRTLPEDYYYFWGDGKHNHFRKTWKSHDYWDWSLDNPYED